MFDLAFVAKSRRTVGVLRVHSGTGESLFTAIGVLFVFSRDKRVRRSYSEAQWRKSFHLMLNKLLLSSVPKGTRQLHVNSEEYRFALMLNTGLMMVIA